MMILFVFVAMGGPIFAMLFLAHSQFKEEEAKDELDADLPPPVLTVIPTMDQLRGSSVHLRNLKGKVDLIGYLPIADRQLIKHVDYYFQESFLVDITGRIHTIASDSYLGGIPNSKMKEDARWLAEALDVEFSEGT